MYFRYFKIISPWKRAGSFIWTNLNPLHPKKLVPSLVENGSVVLEKKIFKFHQCIFTISKLFPFGKGRGPSFEQTWIPFIQGCFVPSLVEIGSVVLEKKIFKFCQCIFAISQLSPLGKGRGPSFEQTWIPFTRGCFVPSLVEIGSVILEKKIYEFRQCIFAFSLLSPLGEGWGPSFEQTWIPFTQEYFVPSLVKIGPVVLEKTIFKSCQFIFNNSQLSPLWDLGTLGTWIPFTQGHFVPSLVEIGPVVLEKKMKMWKVYRQTDGRTDGRTDRRQVIRKAHLSFQLRWAKKACLGIHFRWVKRRQS